MQFNTGSSPAPRPRVVRVSLDDTLKLMKAELKREFPTVEFSIRRSRGTGYGYVDVNYVNGPAWREVEAITNGYEGSKFDGMTDMESGIVHTSADGNGNMIEVDYGTRGILVHREITQDVRAAVARLIVARFGNFAEAREQLLALSDADLVTKARTVRAWGHFDLSDLVHQALSNDSGFRELQQEVDAIIAKSNGAAVAREKRKADRAAAKAQAAKNKATRKSEIEGSDYPKIGEVEVLGKKYDVHRMPIDGILRDTNIRNRFALVSPKGLAFGVIDRGRRWHLTVYRLAMRRSQRGIPGLTRKDLAAFGVEV